MKPDQSPLSLEEWAERILGDCGIERNPQIITRLAFWLNEFQIAVLGYMAKAEKK